LYNSLKKAELRLADYVLKHPDEVSGLTINEVQNKSGTSYATIIRFCKRLGYSGFKEFKNNLFTNNGSDKPYTDLAAGYSINQADTTESIINKTFLSSAKTLQESQDIINIAELEKACENIVESGNVYFVGTGNSGVCAQYAFTRFYRIGLNCSFETDPTLYKLKSSIMKKDEVLFAISSSGRSVNIVDTARIAREHGATVISLCDFAISPLTKISNINLYTSPRNSTQYSDLDVQLFIAQINIIDILFFKSCTLLGQEAIEALSTTKKYSEGEKL